MIIQLQQKAAAPPPAVPAGKAPMAIPVGQSGTMAMAGHAPPPAAIRAPTGTYARAPVAVAQVRTKPSGSAGQKIALIGVWAVGLVIVAGAIYGMTRLAATRDDRPVAVVDPVAPDVTAPPERKDPPRRDPIRKDPPVNTEPKDPPKKETPKEIPKEPKPPSKTVPKDPSMPKDPPKEPPKNPPTGVVPKVPRPPMPKPPMTGQTPPGPNPTPANPANPVGRPLPGPVAVAGDITNRRLLTISVNNPLYFNSVNYGQRAHDLFKPGGEMAKAFKIASTQVTELSDGAPDKAARPPLKQIVDKAIDDLLTSSRAQDRIILLFSGHVLEIEDEAYLIPLEGEKEDKDTLIPVKGLLERMTKCKARQKVLILDLCRFDPYRGAERPDSGKMGEKLDALLKEPPAGVQVWSSCVAGQYSLETPTFGGIFLFEIFEALSGRDKANLGAQTGKDELPIDQLSKTVNKRTAETSMAVLKQEQTPRLTGEEIVAGAAPFNAAEPAPKSVEVDWKDAGGGVIGIAPKGQIEAILRETADIPPVKIPQQGVRPINAQTFPMFSAAILKDYKVDDEKSPLREAINGATAVLKKHATTFQEDFRTNNIEELKKLITPIQKSLATTKLELEEALDALDAAAKKKTEDKTALESEKSKRWLANYDYVTARLKMRIAYVFEYQYMLSEIRTDSLPERPEGSPGWQLASKEKMTSKGQEGKDAKKLATDAKEVLVKLSGEHKGTPWEILGKREALTNLGLEWQPLAALAGAAAPAKK